MIKNYCQGRKSGDDQGVSQKTNDSNGLFENLTWMTTEEAARYLRKTPNAIRIMVHNRIIKARKFRRRLYFKKCEIDALIETSFVVGGY